LSASSAAQRVAWPRIPAVAEALFATVLAALGYFALQGELPYHDAERFTAQVNSGVFVWDIAHILLQPTAMLLHRWSGADAVDTLKAFSSLATAVAVGLFHLLLLRLDVPRGQAVLGTLLLAGCCSVLTLAPSAHPKLVAFPFVTGAFLCLCVAERRGMRAIGLLLLGGVLLALGGGYLASALTTAPFAALAVLFGARRGGAGWGGALWRAAVMGGACGLVFLVIACAGFVVLTGEPLSVAGLTHSVANKADLRPAPVALAVHLARLVFGTVNNLVAVPDLGATAQAWMRGQIPSLQPYTGLLPILALWLLTGLLIAAIYVRTAVAVLGGRSCLVPAAFLCGAQTWTIWYGLNDPEHWFQLTAPTIVLFLTLMPAAVVRLVLPAWTVIATAANLALLAVPVATYPLARHEAELARMLGPNDLLVLFAAYPGRPYAGFYTMPDVHELPVDLWLREPGATVDGVFHKMDATVDQTLQAGGRVLVADILDPLEWEAPWMALLGQGITKDRLDKALLGSRTAARLDDLGGLKLWELHRSPPTPPAPPG
jgi:hypothetical protein